MKHILIKCPDFEHSRRKYFNCNGLAEIFEETPETNIMTYLKEMGFYGRLNILINSLNSCYSLVFNL